MSSNTDDDGHYGLRRSKLKHTPVAEATSTNGNNRKSVNIHHAKAIQAHTRLIETLDILDEMERTYAEQVTQAERRESRLKRKMKAFAEEARKAEQEMIEMRDVVLKLVDRIEASKSYNTLRASQLHVSSLLEPLAVKDPRTSPRIPDTEDLLSYAASMIEVLRKERDAERKAHQQTKEWARSRIVALEARLSRREAELSQCVSHCGGRKGGDVVSGAGEDDGGDAQALPYEKVTDMLEWAVTRNRALEMEIDSLSRKILETRNTAQNLDEIRNNPDDSTSHLTQRPTPSGQPVIPSTPMPTLLLSQNSHLEGFHQQVKELEGQITNLQAERANWASIVDAEKLNSVKAFSESLAHRLTTLEEECARLHESQRDLRNQLEETRAEADRKSDAVKGDVDRLSARLADILTGPSAAQSLEPATNLLDVSPNDLLEVDNHGEMSMDLATPLIPTLLMENPGLRTPDPDDSPNPLPFRPSVTPSPFELSPNYSPVEPSPIYSPEAPAPLSLESSEPPLVPLPPSP